MKPELVARQELPVQTISRPMVGRLETPADVKNFMYAGKATITLVSVVSGTRFTFRVQRSKEDLSRPSVYFVSLMNGPDNEGDYQYMGIISEEKTFKRTSKSRITEDVKSYKAFSWMFSRLSLAMLPDELQVWHEGRCGRCNRKLTVPESIERGIGPECATKM